MRNALLTEIVRGFPALMQPVCVGAFSFPCSNPKSQKPILAFVLGNVDSPKRNQEVLLPVGFEKNATFARLK